MRTNRFHATIVAASTLCFLVASVPAPAAPPANGNSQQQQRAQQQLQLQQQQLYQQQQQVQQQQQQQQLLDQQQQQQRQQQQQMQQQNAADAAQLNSLNADAAKARAELKKAQVSLQAAAHKFESTIDGKPEVQAALKEFKQAQDNLQSATAGATQSLKTNPDYLKAQNEARDARARVEALRGDQSATPQERFTAASASLQANKAVTAFESAALNKEPRVAEARTKLTAANDALRKAREAYSGILHDDPVWQAANAEVEQKQKDVAAADAKLADARKSVADRIASRTAGAQNRPGNTAITPATRPAQ